jgi:rare lipoprotein A
MTRHLALGFIAIAALLACPRETAQARDTSGSGRTTAPPLADDATGWFGESGTASYYGPGQDGRRSASGLRFDQRLLTAAHPWLPFGTKIRVTLGDTGRSVIVTITDRLFSGRRIVDLSMAAARELGIIRRGLAKVTLTLVLRAGLEWRLRAENDSHTGRR